MKLKVKDGTNRDESLCEGCGHFRKRVLQNGTVIRLCSRMWQETMPIEYKVVECNDFVKAYSQSLADMYKQAWYLRTNNSGLAVGFMSRKDFVEKFGDEEANKGINR